MKIRILYLATLFLFSTFVINTGLHGDEGTGLHGDEGWMTDYKKALQQAHEEKKDLLLDFTGSDWCTFCKRIHNDIFMQPSFINFAKKNLILVEVDFPQDKKQSDDLKKQNADLQNQYGVEGFPTLILLDPNGKIIKKSVGYMQGSPEGFIKWVEKN